MLAQEHWPPRKKESKAAMDRGPHEFKTVRASILVCGGPLPLNGSRADLYDPQETALHTCFPDVYSQSYAVLEACLRLVSFNILHPLTGFASQRRSQNAAHAPMKRCNEGLCTDKSGRSILTTLVFVERRFRPVAIIALLQNGVASWRGGCSMKVATGGSRAFHVGNIWSSG